MEAKDLIEFKDLAELGATHWKAPETYHFLDTFPLVPISDTELLLSAHHFPIAISYDEHAPQVVAILDPDFQRTALIDTRGRWQRTYVPIALRSLPFRLDNQPGTEPRLQAAPQLALLGNEGKALFQADGSPTRALTAIRDLLTTLREGRERLRVAAERLILADLLSPIIVPERSAAAPPLLTVEERHLDRLTGRRAAALASERMLELDLAIACFFSQRHFNDAIRWAPESLLREAASPIEILIKGMEDLPVILDSSELFSIDMLEASDGI